MDTRLLDELNSCTAKPVFLDTPIHLLEGVAPIVICLLGVAFKEVTTNPYVIGVLLAAWMMVCTMYTVDRWVRWYHRTYLRVPANRGWMWACRLTKPVVRGVFTLRDAVKHVGTWPGQCIIQVYIISCMFGYFFKGFVFFLLGIIMVPVLSIGVLVGGLACFVLYAVGFLYSVCWATKDGVVFVQTLTPSHALHGLRRAA